jgi:hypothetical protein
MINLFEEAGFESYYPDKQVLLARAEANEKLSAIKEQVSDTLSKKRGYEIRWENLSSKFILDHIYKIDHGIITFSQSHYCRLGIQITENSSKVSAKYEQILELQKAGAYAGFFANVVLIYAKSGSKQGGVFWSEEEKEAVIDKLYDLADRACSCSHAFIAEIQMP